MENKTLCKYRRSIDNVDGAMINILAERFKASHAIDTLSNAQNCANTDLEREDYQVSRLRKLADDANLDADFCERLLRFIIAEAIRHRERNTHADTHTGNGERFDGTILPTFRAE